MISSAMWPPTSKASASAAASWTWRGWMTALSGEFDDLKNELILVRQHGYAETAIIAKSEHFFQTCDEATNLAEVYSQKRATALDFLEKVVLADIVGLLLCSVIRFSRPCGTRP